MEHALHFGNVRLLTFGDVPTTVACQKVRYLHGLWLNYAVLVTKRDNASPRLLTDPATDHLH